MSITLSQKFLTNRQTFLVAAILLILMTFLESSQRLTAKQKAKNEPIAAHLFSETSGYVHNWVKLPDIIGHDLNGKAVVQKSEPGRIDVLIFIASWCVPCQQIIPRMRKLESRFDRTNTRFTYIFSHDLLADVKGFAEEYQIEKAIVASHEILKAYHNPDLPGIYIGDRHGWLLGRFLKLQVDEFTSLSETLSILTAF